MDNAVSTVNTDQVEEYLSFLPDAFVQAHNAEEKAEYKDAEAGDWIAWFDCDYAGDDPNGWKITAYASNFRTEDGKLFCEVESVDVDGDWDFESEAEVGTPDFDELQSTYFDCNKNCDAWEKYGDWCLEHGSDPLDNYSVSRKTRVEEHWTFRYLLAGGSATFVGAYKDGNAEKIKPYAKLDADTKRISKASAEDIRTVLSGDKWEWSEIESGMYDIVCPHQVTKSISKKSYLKKLRGIITKNRG